MHLSLILYSQSAKSKALWHTVSRHCKADFIANTLAPHQSKSLFSSKCISLVIGWKTPLPSRQNIRWAQSDRGHFQTECFGWTVLIYSCASEIYSQGSVTLSLCLQHVINLPRWSSPCQVRHRMDLLLNTRLITSFNNDSLSQSLESMQTEPPIKSQNTNGILFICMRV